MRILVTPIGYAPQIGGSEIHAGHVVRGLAARGHDVEVVVTNLLDTLRPSTTYDRFGPAWERSQHIQIHRLDLRSAPRRFLLQGGAMAWLPGRGQLRRRARRRLVGRAQDWLMARGRAANPDVLLTFGTTQPNVGLTHALGDELDRPVVQVPLLHVLHPSVEHPDVGRTLVRATGIVTNTRYEARFIQDRFGVPEARLTVGRLGVEVPDEAPGRPETPRHLIYLGRLAPEKGLFLLLEAWRRRPASLRDARLVLAGARQNATHEVRRAWGALPAADRERVLWQEQIDEPTKRRLLDEASALVLPSRDESFGLVLLEAWARAVPVITLDLPLFREIVTPGADGLLVEPDDADALAAAMARLHGDGTEARRMGRQGFETARRHGWGAVARRYEEALLRAREAPRPAPHAL